MTDRFVTVPDSLELPAAVKVGVDRLHDSTPAGRALLTGADAAAQRSSLGLGTAATASVGDFATAEQGAKAGTEPVGDSFSGIDSRATLRVLSAFDSGTPTWTHQSGAGVLADDTTNVTYGDKSLKVTLTNGATETIGVTLAAPISLTGSVITMRVYCENWANIEKMWLYVFIPGLLKNYMTSRPTYETREGWATIAFTVEHLLDTPSGGMLPADLGNIQTVWLVTKAKAGTSCAVTYDMLGYAPNALTRPAVVLAFDDARDSVYTIAKPILDRAGYRGVIYTIHDLIGTAGCMTLAQLQTLESLGWDVASHGQIDLTTLNAAQLAAEFHEIHGYLVANGMPRAARHYASHQGVFNALAVSEMRKVFMTHRGTQYGSVTLPAGDRFALPNKGGNNLLGPALIAYVDATIAKKSITIINWHTFGTAPGDGLATSFQALVDYLQTVDVDVITLTDLNRMANLIAP